MDEIPFDSRKKYMAILTADGMIYVKGSPERIIEMCSHELRDEPMEIDRERLRKELHILTSGPPRPCLRNKGTLRWDS